MSQPVTAAPAAAIQNHPFRPYEGEAFIGAITTAACGLLINPVVGAALGVYFITNIGANLAGDYFMGNNHDPIARVAKAAFSCLVAIGVALGVASAFVGVIVPITPILVAGIVALVCICAMNAIADARTNMERAMPPQPAVVATPSNA